MKLVILKNGNLEWEGNFELSWSGFGFVALDRNEDHYCLSASGILLWRKLRLLKNGEEIDQIKVNRSTRYPIKLKRRMDLFINNENVFSIKQHRILTDHGHLLMSWKCKPIKEMPTVYAILLACIQNSGKVYVSAMP